MEWVSCFQKDTMLHFVGFRGDEYLSALRAFGKPDFWHRNWDMRALQEVAPGDTVIFAREAGTKPPSPFSFNDSEQF